MANSAAMHDSLNTGRVAENKNSNMYKSSTKFARHNHISCLGILQIGVNVTDYINTVYYIRAYHIFKISCNVEITSLLKQHWKLANSILECKN